MAAVIFPNNPGSHAQTNLTMKLALVIPGWASEMSPKGGLGFRAMVVILPHIRLDPPD